ncbi:MAG: hypothetical protein IJF18_00055 [Oscillospiraceae bacterium]|nr:hypothetical protein [Oscillospiraceae bacterium]
MTSTAQTINRIEVNRRIPRMIPLKEAAKETGLSERFLRNAFVTGELVGIRSGGNSKNGKILLNFDKLIDYLNVHTEQTEEQPVSNGAIRPVRL